MKLRFDPFVLDCTRRQLLRDTAIVHLSPKAFDLLALLMARRPELLSKRKIYREVWAGTHVSPGSLAVVVAEIRKALGDDAKAPRFIRTAHRVGYAFCGDATRVAEPRGQADAFSLELTWWTERAALGQGTHILGRGDETDICVDSPDVSRRHAELSVDGTTVTLVDLGSKNGTFVDGERVDRPITVEPGSAFRLGPIPVRLRIASGGDETTTAVSSV